MRTNGQNLLKATSGDGKSDLLSNSLCFNSGFCMKKRKKKIMYSLSLFRKK